MSAAIESWDDDEDSFVLPSGDNNPIRIPSTSSAASFASSTAASTLRRTGSQADDDNDDDWGIPAVARPELSLSAGPGRTDWEKGGGFDDGFGNDDDDDDDRTDTLKAGSTIKLISPPLQTPTGTVRKLGSKVSLTAAALKLSAPDHDIEDGFDLPPTFSRLSLRPLRPQSSRASFTSAASDASPSVAVSPSSSTTSSSSSSFHRQTMEQRSSHQPLLVPSSSSTPLNPFSPPSLVRSSSAEPSSDQDPDFADPEGEDSLDGILLPDPLFFTRPNSNVRLQHLLDAKAGKGQYRGTASSDTVRISSGTSGPDDDEDASFEAGLVIDDALTLGRLKVVRAKARSRTLPLPRPGSSVAAAAAARRRGTANATGSGMGGTIPSGRSSTKEDWERDLEREVRYGRSKSPNIGFGSSTVARPVVSSSTASPAAISTRPRASQPSRSGTSGNLLSPSPPSTLRGDPISRPSGVPVPSRSRTAGLAVAPPSPSPTPFNYAGSHAQTLLSRKASLPMLRSSNPNATHPHEDDDDDDFGRATPSALGAGMRTNSGGGPAVPSSSSQSRFAVPTAASLARQRDRPGHSHLSHDLFVPPTVAGAASSSSSTSSLPPIPLLFPPGPSSSHQPAATTPAAFSQRLTMPTSSSRQKIRAPVPPSLFGTSTGSSTLSASAARVTPPAVKMLQQPLSRRTYGKGTELDGFPDLEIDREKEGRYRVGGAERKLSKPSSNSHLSSTAASFSRKAAPSASVSASPVAVRPRTTSASSPLGGTVSSDLKRKKAASGHHQKDSSRSSSTAGSGGHAPPSSSPTPAGKLKKRPHLNLIQNLGSSHKEAKIVGKMRYNPKTLKWEGNDQALQAFEPALASSRPALITQLTGTSISSLASLGGRSSSALGGVGGSAVKVPPGSPSATALKVVGNMQFDPIRMCWVSLLSKEEDEPDPFEGIDDDDDMGAGSSSHGNDDAHSNRSGDYLGAAEGGEAARRNRSGRARAGRLSEALSAAFSSDHENDDDDAGTSLDEEDRRIAREFRRHCRRAEEGHRAEVAGWALGALMDVERERARLWEIRKVAMKAGREGGRP